MVWRQVLKEPAFLWCMGSICYSWLQRNFRAAGYSLTAERWHVLINLGEQGGQTQQQLSDKTEKNKGNITRLISNSFLCLFDFWFIELSCKWVILAWQPVNGNAIQFVGAGNRLTVRYRKSWNNSTTWDFPEPLLFNSGLYPVCHSLSIFSVLCGLS